MTTLPTAFASVEDMASAVRAMYPAGYRLTLGLGTCVIAVSTDSLALHGALCDYFSSFVVEDGPAHIHITAHEATIPALQLPFVEKQPDPGKSRIKEEYCDLRDGRVVRKRLTGMVFAFGHGVNVAVGPCLANANQVVNFVNNRLIEYLLDRGCLLGHASGVGLGGRGLCLAGFSGMGKSTLALHLLSRGLDFISNDRMLVEDAGPSGVIMHGVAKQPRINPGTALNNPDLARVLTPEEHTRFGSLPVDELWSLEHKYDALVEECFGPGRFTLHAPMDGLVVLNWRRDGGPMVARRVIPDERRDLLAAFMKEPGVFYMPSGAQPDLSEEAYVRLLSRTALVEVTGGVDFDAAASVCEAFLKDGSL